MDADALTNLIKASNLGALQQPLPRDLVTSPTTLGHTPLHWAAVSDMPEILSHILSNASTIDPVARTPEQRGQTPLHWACVSGPLSNVLTLLSHGANPAIHDDKGYTAVAHAAQYGRVDVLHILLKIAPELVGAWDKLGHTPLMWASYYDHHPAAVYLLKVHEVPVDDVDTSGMTALHRAAQGDSWLIADALLRHGADWAIRDNEEKNAVDVSNGLSRVLLSEWKEGRLTRERPVRERRHWKRFAIVTFYYVVFAVSYLQYWPIRYVLSPGLNAIAHVCLFVSICSHMLATFSDPGDLVKGDKKSFVEFVEKCVKEGFSETRLLPSAFCYSCLVQRPPRSKHSRERDVCVRRFDHECPWVNNTVGLRTHKPLLSLAVSTGIAEICFIIAVGRAIHAVAMESSLMDGILAYPFSLVLTVVHAAICIFCVVLFASQAALVTRGMTTYEHLVAVRENVSNNPYDKGVWNNIVAFLTSSGPGTGRPWVELSVRTLREVVLSSGECTDKTVEEEKQLLEEV